MWNCRETCLLRMLDDDPCCWRDVRQAFEVRRFEVAPALEHLLLLLPVVEQPGKHGDRAAVLIGVCDHAAVGERAFCAKVLPLKSRLLEWSPA